MEITRAVDYGVRCVIYMATASNGKRLLLSEICKDQQVPVSFTAKIFQSLTKAGIVKSFRGVKGGFKLARDPGEITLKEVIEAIDGPLTINICLEEAGICKRDIICPAHPVWREVQGRITDVLEKYTLSDLVREGKRLSEEHGEEFRKRINPRS